MELSAFKKSPIFDSLSHWTDTGNISDLSIGEILTGRSVVKERLIWRQSLAYFRLPLLEELSLAQETNSIAEVSCED